MSSRRGERGPKITAWAGSLLGDTSFFQGRLKMCCLEAVIISVTDELLNAPEQRSRYSTVIQSRPDEACVVQFSRPDSTST